MKNGELERAIWRWKFEGKFGWGIIFGRVLAGYLRENVSAESVDLIIPSPTYLPDRENQPDWCDMTRFVVEQAAGNDDAGLPFRTDPPVVVRTFQTPRMRDQKNLAGRTAAAEALRSALVVPDPGLVVGARIVVYDDVFTSGRTLNEVARALKAAGASSVSQVALARQPWLTWAPLQLPHL